MKIKTIIITLLMIAIMATMFNAISVNAAEGDSYKISLSTTTTKAKPGDTVTVTLNVSDINIQSGEKGIGAYQGTIEYDTDVFEEVKMTGNENWDKPLLNEGNFTSVNSDGKCVSEAQELATISLKVKASAKAGTGKVEIKNFAASNGVENISTSGKSTTITIEKADSGNSGTPEGTVTPGGTTTTTKSPSATASKGSLPKTGKSEVMATIIVIIAIVGIASYIGYKRTY